MLGAVRVLLWSDWVKRDGDGGATAVVVSTECLGTGREPVEEVWCWAKTSWSAGGLPLAGASRFRCAGTVVPGCAATGDMRLTLSLESSTPAEQRAGLVSSESAGQQSHALPTAGGVRVVALGSLAARRDRAVRRGEARRGN